MSAGLSQMALLLTNPERLVIDRTGVTDKFDFHLEYSLEMANSADTSATSIPSAVIARATPQMGRSPGSWDCPATRGAQSPCSARCSFEQPNARNVRPSLV